MTILTELFTINGIPAVLCGAPSGKAYLFVHGKCGYKEEAAAFAEVACPAGYQVLAVDLPGHGERKAMQNAFNPWTVVPELQSVLTYMKPRWDGISLRANSIGAYFSMQAFSDADVRRALFVSPIVDMEKCIRDMMTWANVSEAKLREKGEIPTAFGETLSWKYLCWVRAHPIAHWHAPTAILYAGRDNLTAREAVEAFSSAHHTSLTIMESGEHWFHTPEQLAVLKSWETHNIGNEV